MVLPDFSTTIITCRYSGVSLSTPPGEREPSEDCALAGLCTLCGTIGDVTKLANAADFRSAVLRTCPTCLTRLQPTENRFNVFFRECQVATQP